MTKPFVIRRSLLPGLRRAVGRFHARMLAGAGVRTRRQKSRYYLARGAQHMLKDEFFEAVVEYKAAVEADPTDVYAVVNRGNAWLHLKDYEMALADFETGLRLDANCWFAFFGRGYVRLILNDHARARDDFTRALALLETAADDKQSVLHRHRAGCFFALADYEAAEADADACLKLSPDDSEALDIRGRARTKLGWLELALQDFSDALRIGPATADLFACRGYVYDRLNRPADALADYEQVVRLTPEDVDSQCYLGYLLAQCGQPLRARDRYEQLLATHPDHSLVKNNYAWLLATAADASIRNGPRAVELATSACAQTEWKVAHYLGTLAAASAEVGDFQSAVQHQTRALELFTDEERPSAAKILKTFQAGQPHRDPPSGNVTPAVPGV